MLIFLTTLRATLSSFLRSRAALELENLALRHQIGVLQRSAAKRPKLTPWDRLAPRSPSRESGSSPAACRAQAASSAPKDKFFRQALLAARSSMLAGMGTSTPCRQA